MEEDCGVREGHLWMLARMTRGREGHWLYRRNQPQWHFDLGLWASGTVKTSCWWSHSGCGILCWQLKRLTEAQERRGSRCSGRGTNTLPSLGFCSPSGIWGKAICWREGQRSGGGRGNREEKKWRNDLERDWNLFGKQEDCHISLNAHLQFVESNLECSHSAECMLFLQQYLASWVGPDGRGWVFSGLWVFQARARQGEKGEGTQNVWGHVLGMERNEGRCVYWREVSVQLKDYFGEDTSVSERKWAGHIECIN